MVKAGGKSFFTDTFYILTLGYSLLSARHVGSQCNIISKFDDNRMNTTRVGASSPLIQGTVKDEFLPTLRMETWMKVLPKISIGNSCSLYALRVRS